MRIAAEVVMRVMVLTVTLLFAAAVAFGQYKPVEAPFQEEYPFAPGQGVLVKVELAGVRIDSITVISLGDGKTPEKARTEVSVVGNVLPDAKAKLVVVLLFETEAGKKLGERIVMEPFKVKSGKEFDQKQIIEIDKATIASAAKLYIFIDLAK